MNLKKTIIILLTLCFALMMGCSKNVLIDEKNSKLLNYDFKIENIRNIDNTLSKQTYCYTKNVDEKYVAVIIYNSNNASMNQYLINKSEALDITIPKECKFILSIPANPIITYTWNIKNNFKNGIIEFEDRSWINIPTPKFEQKSIEINYDRQNFYFDSIKSGNEKLIMRYEHDKEQRNEFFEITFNINIK